MDLSNLKPAAGSKHAKKRIGRGPGTGQGTQAGRGHKGAQSRSGYKFKRGFEGGQMPLHMRLPKLKGFKNPFKTEFQVVNVAMINKLFPKGGAVSVADLVTAGAVRKGQPVKVLGQGDISVAVQVSADAFSESARDKIVAAGGSVTVL